MAKQSAAPEVQHERSHVTLNLRENANAGNAQAAVIWSGKILSAEMKRKARIADKPDGVSDLGQMQGQRAGGWRCCHEHAARKDKAQISRSHAQRQLNTKLEPTTIYLCRGLQAICGEQFYSACCCRQRDAMPAARAESPPTDRDEPELHRLELNSGFIFSIARWLAALVTSAKGSPKN